MIIEPNIKSNFEKGFAESNVKTLENNLGLTELMKEKEEYISANLDLQAEIEKLKAENKKLKSELDGKKKKGGE